MDSISALEGAMIHSLVEAGLVFVSKMNNTEEKNGSLIASLYSVLMEKVNSIVNAELENLYGLSADDQDIRSSLEAFVPQIVKWLEHNIIRPDPKLVKFPTI